MTFKYLRTELSEGVMTLVLDRPDKLNSCTFQMLDEFSQALHEANEDDEVRAVIVTGAGRAFCAGTDLSGAEGSYDASESIGEEIGGVPRDVGGRLSLQMFDYDKPLIAAVNGAAAGYGVTMTLPMDIRIASTDARFGFVFSRRGLIPEACATWFLPRIVGISRALEWVESGRMVDAQEALAAGLVREVVAPGDLRRRATELAHSLIDNSSAVSVMLARRIMLKMLGADHPMKAHELESRGLALIRESADFKEGVASFLEKRPPRFPQKAHADRPEGFPWWRERPFDPTVDGQ